MGNKITIILVMLCVCLVGIVSASTTSVDFNIVDPNAIDSKVIEPMPTHTLSYGNYLVIALIILVLFYLLNRVYLNR